MANKNEFDWSNPPSLHIFSSKVSTRIPVDVRIAKHRLSRVNYFPGDELILVAVLATKPTNGSRDLGRKRIRVFLHRQVKSNDTNDCTRWHERLLEECTFLRSERRTVAFAVSQLSTRRWAIHIYVLRNERFESRGCRLRGGGKEIAKEGIFRKIDANN